jgi:hypothetical protein
VNSNPFLRTQSSPRPAAFLAAILFLVASAVALTGCTTRPTDQTTPPTGSATRTAVAVQPANTTAEDLEQRFGIQMTLVAVTAGGGLIDIRFRVTDAAKAADLFKAENLPIVIAPDSGVTIKPPEPPDPGQLTDGQIYFLLYPNSGGAIKPGSKVILAFGDLRLEYQTAP